LKLLKMGILLIFSTLIISGCATDQKALDFTPTLIKTKLSLPYNPTQQDYERVILPLMQQRTACYDDLAAIERDYQKLNKKWWEIWK
jgi:uncharacterized lipoprotein YajG